MNSKDLLRDEKTRLRALCASHATLWTDASIGDVLPHPSPLIVDSFQRASGDRGGIARAFRALGLGYRRRPQGPELFELICGRTYINLAEYLATVRAGIPIRPRFDLKGRVKVGLAPDFFGWLLVPVALPWRAAIFCWRFFRLRRRHHVEFKKRQGPALTERARTMRADDLTKLSEAQLWERYEQLAAESAGELTYSHLLTDVIAGLTQTFFRALLIALQGPARAKDLEPLLTTGLDGNFNTETNLALHDVASGKMTLEAFLDRYGHRGNPDWDPAAPRWRETPEKLQRFAAKLAGPGAKGREQFERQKSQRLATEAELERTLKGTARGLLLGKLFWSELRLFQIYSPLREATQSANFLWIELSRQVVAELARRTAAGELLYFLRHDELSTFFRKPERRAELLGIARVRSAELQLLRREYLPHVLTSENLHEIGSPPALSQGMSTLTGETVCAGFVRARARVVTNLGDAQELELGEILVTQFTDPSWTPLFLIAGGLVLEQGSTLSHGALVAREYGLPALVNVREATRLIRTGQTITLDAARGLIMLT